MKKTIIAATGLALIALSGQSIAAGDVGKKIYDRAFGRGCGACHDISSNPQLRELIKSGALDRAKFGTVLKEGRNGMPKAMDQIMSLGPVKKAGLTEDQAIDAVYEYLSE
ncbi:MAG: cytochrome c [Gammaproteobacteria bacterium]